MNKIGICLLLILMANIISFSQNRREFNEKEWKNEIHRLKLIKAESIKEMEELKEEISELKMTSESLQTYDDCVWENLTMVGAKKIDVDNYARRVIDLTRKIDNKVSPKVERIKELNALQESQISALPAFYFKVHDQLQQKLDAWFDPSENKMIRDTDPPIIAITSPPNTRGFISASGEDKLRIEGNVKDQSDIKSVLINTQKIQLNFEDQFSCLVALKPGINEFTVEAADIYNNKSSIMLIVQKENIIQPQMVKNEGYLEGQYYALLIGCKEYRNSSIKDLQYPIRDANLLKEQLIKYSFLHKNIFFLKNPSRQEIFDILDGLSERISSNDNLLIFYAGHGYWDEKLEQGFWLPSDAKKESRANWISNGTIRDYINGIKSKHTLLLSDACFAGGIFQTRKAFDNVSNDIKELYKYSSREAMTSGNMNEVPDKSAFIEYIVKRLKENDNNIITSTELFSKIRKAVINNSPNNQVPQFGVINQTGDEGGDFIFIKNN